MAEGFEPPLVWYRRWALRCGVQIVARKSTKSTVQLTHLAPSSPHEAIIHPP